MQTESETEIGRDTNQTKILLLLQTDKQRIKTLNFTSFLPALYY